MRQMKRWIKRAIVSANSGVVDSSVLRLLETSQKRKKSVSGLLRAVIQEAVSDDPLRDSANLPEIDIVIPFAGKDQLLVPFVVHSALLSSRNPVGTVRLVTPELDADGARETIFTTRNLLDKLGVKLQVESDRDVLSPELGAVLDRTVDIGRNRGWLAQQLIKLLSVMNSDKPACLVVDADTVLLQRRTWLAEDGSQIIIPTEWIRSFWTADVENFLGRHKRFPFSYITHHQLMQKDILRELFGQSGEGITDWVSQANTVISEYELYGSYLEICHRPRFRIARFGNLESANRDSVSAMSSYEDWEKLRTQCGPGINSLSLHHYLSRRREEPEE